MKQKYKFLVLLLIVFLLSGCKAEVNVNITKDKISNKITIETNNDEYNRYASSYREFFPAYFEDNVSDEMPDEELVDVEYFSYSKTPTSGGMVFNYSYDYPLADYINSTPLQVAFTSSTIEVDKKTDSIIVHINDLTDDNGKTYEVPLFDSYSNLDELRINVTSELKVISNNADSYRDGVYTWIFNRNHTDKKIDLIVDSGGNNSVVINTTKSINYGDLTTEANESKEKEKNNNETSKVTKILAPIFLVFFVGAVILLMIPIIRKNISI